MCGRYVLKASTIDLKRQFNLDEVPQLSARYNIAPLQAAPIIQSVKPRALVLAQWGLLPAWAKDAKLAHQLINARAETLGEKNAFKELIAAHRCVVPADGFYEWRHEGRQRLPHYVHPRGGQLLAFAGLWSHWRSAEGVEVDTFTIITTVANSDVHELHERMPSCLDDEARALWLSDTTDRAALQQVLLASAPGLLRIDAVSPHVNSVSVDDERCLEPPATVQLKLL